MPDDTHDLAAQMRQRGAEPDHDDHVWTWDWSLRRAHAAQAIAMQAIERRHRTADRPDATPQDRGAEPVTIRFRPDGANATQRHAAYRLPQDHEDACRLDRLFHGRHFSDHAPTNSQRYANACAVLRLYEAAGLGRSRGVAA